MLSETPERAEGPSCRMENWTRYTKLCWISYFEHLPAACHTWAPVARKLRHVEMCRMLDELWTSITPGNHLVD